MSSYFFQITQQYPKGIRKKSDYQYHNQQLPNRKKSISQLAEIKYGVYQMQQYRMVKGFIQAVGGGTIKLSYTKFQPYTSNNQNNNMSSLGTKISYSNLKKIGSVCIIHGFGECSKDYLEIADSFVKARFVVHLIDLRGYGFSGGSRVHQNLQGLYLDIQTVLGCCESSLPKFIYSHGMGATLVISLLLDNISLPIAGVIVSNPTFNFPQQQNINSFYPKIFDNHFTAFIKFLTSTIFQDLIVCTSLNPTSFTKINDNVYKKLNSNIIYHYVTLKLKKQLEMTSAYVKSKFHFFKHPILIFAGSLDSIQPLRDTEQFFLNISSEDKTLKRFPRGYHYLHIDEQCQQIKREAINWMQEKSRQWRRTEEQRLKTKIINGRKQVNLVERSERLMKGVNLLLILKKIFKKYGGIFVIGFIFILIYKFKSFKQKYFQKK